VVFVRSIQAFSNFTWKRFDVGVIDRLVVGLGITTERTGETVRVVQNGSIQFYAFILLIGIVLSVGYLIYGIS
jgi:NADH:ubiquinone oxidoreductase subunit 5 (subunit L)/multisubunit Na+/H+ antiporter MnhA subunit